MKCETTCWTPKLAHGTASETVPGGIITFKKKGTEKMKRTALFAAMAASMMLPMVANADGEPEIVVGAGETYSVTDASVYRFRHYRFKIDNCMGNRNGLQISEFRLMNGDVDVTSLRSGFSYGEGMDSSTTQYPSLAVDGDLTTKWYTTNGSSSSDMSKCWIQLDFAEPQPITAYDWATAEDRWLGQNSGDKRDPMVFRLLGSDDGETWTELDSRDIGAKNITRRSWTGPYYALRSIGRVRLEGGVFEAQADIALSGVALHSGTMKIPTNRTVRIVSSESVSGVVGSLVVHGTLELQGTVFAHSLSGNGTVKGLSSGGDYVALCVESGNNPAYDGRIAWMDGAGLLKTGGGEVQYTGYALCDAPLVVQGGVLKLADATPSFRHWRFKIDDCMGGMRNGVQISELRLLNGNVDVTSLRSGFSYGEGMDSNSAQGPTLTVDGNLTTKWFTANGSTYSDMSKCWLQLDYADPQPVTAYAWATANDRGYVQYTNLSSDTRDPAKFCLLGSDDGDTWEKIGWRYIGSSKVIARNTWTGPYAIGAHYGTTSLRGGVLEVRRDVEFASVEQSGGEVLVPEGFTARLAAGGTWMAPLVASGSKGRIDVSAGTVSGAFVVSNGSDITLAASSLPGGVTLNGASSVTFAGNANIDGMAFHVADPKAANAFRKVIVAAEGTLTGEPVFTLGANGYKVKQVASGGYSVYSVGLMIIVK